MRLFFFRPGWRATLTVLALLVTAASCTSTAPSTGSRAAPPDRPSVRTTSPAPGGASVQVGYNEGQMVPDFTLRLVDGGQVTRADLLAQGRPAFLFFYATW